MSGKTDLFPLLTPESRRRAVWRSARPDYRRWLRSGPGLEIGSRHRLTSRAAEIADGLTLGQDADWLESTGGIDTTGSPLGAVILCNASCSWHEDEAIGDPYSGLLVIRDDARSWVRARGMAESRSQPPGTVMILNVRRTHRLACRLGATGLWGAVAIDYEDRPTIGRVAGDFAEAGWIWAADVERVEDETTPAGPV